MRLRLFLILLALSFAALPASAAPNAQLLRSIEHRLTVWNVGPVDTSQLTTSQAAQLHLKLTNAPSRFGRHAIMFRQELLTILRRTK